VNVWKPRLSSQDYAALVEQAPIMIWRARTDTLCDYFNDRWLAFTGRSMDQEFGNGWVEGVHPDDLQRCVDHYLEHFHRREPFEMEYRLRRHDGAWRWIFDRGVPLFDDQGNQGGFRGYTGSCIDVTERVEAHETLALAQEKQIQTLQRLLPICMFCKKIKKDDGAWEELDRYVREHSDTDFSHGFCPDCYPKYTARLQQEVAAYKASPRGPAPSG
jgi:PAS domain S-box-containing protein